MSKTKAISAPITQADSRHSLRRAPLTVLSTLLSSYFILACCLFYWLTAGAGALVGVVLPRRLLARAPLAWLSVSSLLMAAATQTITGFFPDYGNPREIALDLVHWLAIGLFARSYLVYTECPETFDGLKQSIASRPLERWISSVIHKPIDAIFTRVWIANSIAVIPLTVLLLVPTTMNYFVVGAYGLVLLLIQLPHDLIDHVNIHTRVFQPKIGASPRARLVLSALQFYLENVLAVLVARAPHYYRVQHVYVHHVEDNGPRDSQTTAPYDRTSFLDFSRHAFLQGLDLVSGIAVFRYLRTKGKMRQVRDLVRGLVIWYIVLVVIALFNPLAAAMVFASRFVGGNIQSLVSFWQHGLVDPADVHDTHGNTVNYFGHEHGHLGTDFHVEHHLQPGRHWSVYYEVFSQQLKSEGGHAAVVMQKQMFGPLVFVAALWRKDYKAIAAYARLGGVEEGNTDELADIVRQRTRPIGGSERTGLAARVDALIGSLMALALPTSIRV